MQIKNIGIQYNIAELKTVYKRQLFKEWIRHSYLEVIKKLPRIQQEKILHQFEEMDNKK